MFRRPAHGTRRVAVVLAAALVLVTGACGGDDDGDEDDDGQRVIETSVPDGSSSTQPAAASDDTEGTGPTGGPGPEIDDELLREAHEYFAQQVRLLAPEAVERPLDEFADAVVEACRAVADPAPLTPDERAEAVADVIDDREGIAGWRGVAIGVATQYFFLGGCDVPDRDAVVEALAPRITEGLGGQ